jgi:hypothetical protein
MVKVGIIQSILAGYYPQQQPQPQPTYPPPQQQPPPQAAPPPAAAPPPPKKAAKPWLLPFVFALIAVVFLLLAIIGPWQSATIEYKSDYGDYSATGDAYLQSRTTTADEDVLLEPGEEEFTDQVTINYNDKPEDGGMNEDIDEGGSPAELAAWNTCFYLAILAFIMAILMMVFVLMAGTKSNAKMGKLAMIFAILALIFGLLTPIYAVVGIPGARQADFDESIKDWDDSFGEEPELEHNSWWDSYDEGGAEVNLGAGWGWYLGLIGGIMALLGLIFIMKMNKGLKADQPAPAAPPPAPAPAPAPAPQYQQPPPQQPQY